MKEPICGMHIGAKVINKEATQLAIPLIARVEELNYKTRKDTQRALLGLFKHPAMDEAKLVELIMDIVEKKGQKPDKLPERIILGRLELIMYLALIREAAKQTWEWKTIITQLATPSLLSQFPDVRSAAASVIAVFYQSIGETVKSEFLRTS